MLNRRVATVILVAGWIFALTARLIHAQNAGDLPPGIVAVQVDGQPIDAATSPVTANATPEIAGRVDPGAATLDIAVTDGATTRFTADVNEKGRFTSTVPDALANGQYTLSINDVAIGTFTVNDATAAADESQTEGLLDIARVVPYPVDFGDLIPGLGFLDGRFYSLSEEASRTAGREASADDVRSAERGLAAAGWLQRYENRLAAPSADNSQRFDIQISSFVIEYASGGDANSAYTALAGDEAGVEAPTIGDESVVTLLSGVTPDTKADYQAARLIYRVGPLLGMIVYADLRNQPPDLTLLETVAQIVAERGAVVVDRGSVPLGSMALRLDPREAAGPLNRRDLYDVRVGTLTSLYGEDDSTRASRVELFTGTTDAFSSTTNGAFTASERNDRAGKSTPAESTPTESAQPTPTSIFAIEGDEPIRLSTPTPTPSRTTDQDQSAAEDQTAAQTIMVSALYAFPGDGEAETWLSTQRDAILASADAGRLTFREVPDAPAFGDSSVTFAIRREIGADDERADGFRMYGRVGAIVAMLEVASVPEMPLPTATSLMEAQIACIEEDGCGGLTTLSGAISTPLERPKVAEAPRAPTAAAARPPREAPAPPPITEAPPVEEAPPAPVEETAAPPVEEPPPPPAEEATPPPPVEEATPPPAEEATPPPAEEGTPPPIEEATPPGEEETPPPVEEATPPPVAEATPPTGEEPAPPPVGEATPPTGQEPPDSVLIVDGDGSQPAATQEPETTKGSKDDKPSKSNNDGKDGKKDKRN